MGKKIKKRKKTDIVLDDINDLTRIISNDILNRVLTTFPITFYVLQSAEKNNYIFTQISGGVQKLLGYDPLEFINDPDFWLNHLHPEDAAFLLKDKQRVITGSHQTFVYRFLAKDGAYRWLRDEIHAIKTQRDAEYFIGYLVDLTEQKRFEEELRKSEERFRTLVTATTQIVWTTDAKGEVTDDIPSWREYTGQSYDEIKGMGWTAAIHPDDLKSTVSLWEKALAAGSVYQTEYRIRRYDGEYRWFSVHGVPIINNDGQISEWLGTCTDITEAKEKETTLKSYAARLEQSNRDLQEFAYIASHDLQEPVRKILAFGDRLATRYKEALDDRGKDYLERMLSASKRMQNLINSLLTFSRVETRAQPFTKVNLNEVINDVISDLELKIKKLNARVETGDLPVIDADWAQMYQLFENLIGNALKFHRDGVPPVVKIYGTSDYAAKPDQVVIAVEDNGIGIDPQYADRIFKPFQRLHSREEYEGFGMGLAICRRILERHGGDIILHKATNEGSTFIVILPKNHTKVRDLS
ncbi:MAG: PAS domain-containing protein [Calditrichaeota bacterium]|nr:PAS domain-containing protein [Calditrichota bacterium]